jgi:exodeoxyribonuclease-1
MHWSGPESSQGRFCLSLNGDVDRFAAMTDEELQIELAQKPCPVRRLRINAAPTLTALYDARR